MRVLGFMTGTSLDAVDMAVLDTDGETIAEFGPAGERKLDEAIRELLIEATVEALKWDRDAPEPEIFARAARAVAEEHLAAGEAFLAAHELSWSDLDMIGMHGQTVLQERPKDGELGRTVQLGDAKWLAEKTGLPVAHDFRSADMAAGGQGAPLAPIYHLARVKAAGLEPPVAVLNIGGVANITYWTGGDEIAAFDTGPGNGMIDLLVQERGAGRFDEKGRYASVGKVNDGIVRALLAHPYFEAPPPKSLDRFDFSLEPLKDSHLEDGCATLVAFTAEAVRLGVEMMGAKPREIVVTGGGRHNPEIMKALRERLDCPVTTAEDHGWRGDAIEAEAFAYLAARTARGLPISFPKTTGVPKPMTGGVIVKP